MPANKNALLRYKILDELLSNRYHQYSLDNLTEEVNNRLVQNYGMEPIVRRTIEKDLVYIEDFFQTDIERYSSFDEYHGHKRCIKYADENFSIFKKELSDDEKTLLKGALSVLGQFDGLPELGDLEKLRSSLEVEDNDRKIIYFTKNPLEGSNLLGKLFMAIANKQVIRLHYHTFSGRHDQVNVHPYLLKEYNRRWFMIAAAETDGKILTFSIDRIDAVKPLPSHTYVEYDGDLSERFEDIIGVTLVEGSPVYEIKFWVSDSSVNYVRTKPLHESQRHLIGDDELELRTQYPNLIDGRFFLIECRNNYELIRELSSFGKDLLVLSPIEIQNEIWNRFTAMHNEYYKIRQNCEH